MRPRKLLAIFSSFSAFMYGNEISQISNDKLLTIKKEIRIPTDICIKINCEDIGCPYLKIIPDLSNFQKFDFFFFLSRRVRVCINLRMKLISSTVEAIIR